MWPSSCTSVDRRSKSCLVPLMIRNMSSITAWPLLDQLAAGPVAVDRLGGEAERRDRAARSSSTTTSWRPSPLRSPHFGPRFARGEVVRDGVACAGTGRAPCATSFQVSSAVSTSACRSGRPPSSVTADRQAQPVARRDARDRRALGQVLVGAGGQRHQCGEQRGQRRRRRASSRAPSGSWPATLRRRSRRSRRSPTGGRSSARPARRGRGRARSGARRRTRARATGRARRPGARRSPAATNVRGSRALERALDGEARAGERRPGHRLHDARAAGHDERDPVRPAGRLRRGQRDEILRQLRVGRRRAPPPAQRSRTPRARGARPRARPGASRRDYTPPLSRLGKFSGATHELMAVVDQR